VNPFSKKLPIAVPEILLLVPQVPRLPSMASNQLQWIHHFHRLEADRAIDSASTVPSQPLHEANHIVVQSPNDPDAALVVSAT
jgi:hypothetical protein